MTEASGLQPLQRFISTMLTVSREGQHLAYSWRRLYAEPIDAAWVQRLDKQPELAEGLEAFVSRYGRMQDTIGEKLLPRWLVVLAETPGSMIENLNRAERLGVLENVEGWLEARQLRNRLIHEYMEVPQTFAADLQLAREYCRDLFAAYNRLRDYAIARMGVDETALPRLPALDINSQT